MAVENEKLVAIGGGCYYFYLPAQFGSRKRKAGKEAGLLNED